MGRASRRKRPVWRCDYCGAGLNPALHAAASAACARIDRQDGNRHSCVVHVCGACYGMHLLGEDGRLRRPTAGERFAIEMQNGQALDAYRQGKLPLDPQVDGTLLLPEGVKPPRLRPWPTDAVLVVAALLGQENRATMEAVELRVCRDCRQTVAVDSRSLRKAHLLAGQRGLPVDYFCWDCHLDYDLDGVEQIDSPFLKDA